MPNRNANAANASDRIAIAWVLFGLVVLFFIVTIVRLGGHVADRPI